MAVSVLFPRRMRRVILLVAPLLAVAASTAGRDGIILDIDRAQEDRESRLARYTVTEHYAIRNSRFTDPAEAVVATTYVKGEGKT